MKDLVVRFSLFCGLIILPALTVNGQSAIGQLESISGQKINTSSSSSSGISGNDVSMMIMESLIQNLFAPPAQSAQQQQADLLKLQQEQMAAEQALQQKLKEEAEQQQKHEKLVQSSKTLPGNTGQTGMKTIPNTAVVNPAELKQYTPVRTLSASKVPPLPASSAISDEGHPYIDLGLAITKVVVGELVKDKILAFGLNAGFTLIAEDMKAISDIYHNKPCPSTSTILKNTLKQVAEDAQDEIDSYVKGEAVYWVKYCGIKDGIKPINIHRAVKTVEWAQKYDDVKDMFNKGYDVGTDLNKYF